MTTKVAGHHAEVFIERTLGIDGVTYNWQCIVCLAEGEETNDHHTAYVAARAHDRITREEARDG